MISPILPSHDADTIKLRGDLFIAQLAYDFRTSQSAIIAALRPCITPSQPIPHAPAAQTDGEVVSSLASPSVEPDPAASATVDAQGDAAGLQSSEPAASYSIPEAPKSLPDAPDNPADALSQPAEAKTSDQADGGAVSAVNGSARLENADSVEPPSSEPLTDKPGEASVSPAPLTKTEIVRRCHVAHPDWTAAEIAFETGIRRDHVYGLAKNAGVTLPKRADQLKAKAAETIEALKAPPAKPQEPDERPAEPEAPPPPQKPLAATPDSELPPPPPIVRPMQRAPTGRFYLRARASGLYVHQSLQPDTTGDGPMMTADRKWAWYDTFARYKGAKAKWPCLAEMRKEAAHV